MRNKTPKWVRDLEQAADLRAFGQPWEEIARRVQKTVDEVCEWPHRYPDRWQRRLVVTQRDLDDESLGLARHIVRKLLFGKDEKMAREAARLLLITIARRRVEPAPENSTSTSPFHQIADELARMSHEELCRYVDAETARFESELVHEQVAPISN
jgi:hypothetical protein